MTEHGCNLPIGLGKSLIFQALTLVDHIEKQQSHICVVVSPLQSLSLVDDQVAYLRRKEVMAASIGSCTEKKSTLIEKVKVSVVFGFPCQKHGSKSNVEERYLEILFIQINYMLNGHRRSPRNKIIIRLAHKSSSEDFFGSTQDFGESLDNNKKYNRQDRN